MASWALSGKRVSSGPEGEHFRDLTLSCIATRRHGLICNMHRTTAWRRRKRKDRGEPERKNNRGRRLHNANIATKTLWRAAILIDEVINSEPGCPDYRLALREEHLRARRGEVSQIYFKISKWNLPADLVAVTVWRGLHIGRRTRRRLATIWTWPVLAKRLRVACPDLSKQDAERYAIEYAQGNDDTQKWVDFVLEDARSDGQDVRQCCVSKIFRHIKKGMSCYWRKHESYVMCEGWIRNLVKRARIEQSSAELAV